MSEQTPQRSSADLTDNASPAPAAVDPHSPGAVTEPPASPAQDDVASTTEQGSGQQTAASADEAVSAPAASQLQQVSEPGPVSTTEQVVQPRNVSASPAASQPQDPAEPLSAPGSHEVSEQVVSRPMPHAPTPSAPSVIPASPASPAAQPSAPVAPSVAVAPSRSAQFGRVDPDGTVYVRTPEGEKAVGSYPDVPEQEALAYFTRKYDEVFSVAELLFQRVTQTDLSAKDAADNLAKLREAAHDLHAVGDLVALAAKIETIATAVEARKTVEQEQRSVARAEAMARREAIVAEAESIASQPEAKIQWKASSARMRVLLDEWKAAQRGGPKLEREAEQALWHRLSSSRNSFDKLRRVHFAQLSSAQAQANSTKEELIAQAEKLAGSTDWSATAGAFKALMDRWRHAGRAARADDDALWARFKAAQDAFFTAKDTVSAAENEEFKANLVVKEELLAQAQALLPIKDLDRTKAALRTIQEKWDAAGKVPRNDLERIERAMRRVEQSVRDTEDKKWQRTDPEVAARAASLAAQAEVALERYRRDLEKAEKSGNTAKIAKAKEALQARQTWLEQAQRVTGSGA